MTFPERYSPSGSSSRAETGIAIWRHVADSLERAIAAGEHAVGSKLPAEKEIADLFRVNRHTVRRALAALAERGLIRSERGSGTYVEVHRIAYPIGSRTRFTENVGAMGLEAGGRLIASVSEEADAWVARRLGIKAGAPVIRLETLRHANRVPLCLGTTWLSAERFPEADRIYAGKRAMTRTLAHFGVSDYRRANTRVVASLADAADSKLLELRPGSPILLVDSFDVDAQGKPVIASRSRFAAERVEFVIES